MELSIIIVNYNGLEFIGRCLESIKKALSGEGTGNAVEYEVIIVDNGSDDGSIDYLRKLKKNDNAGVLTLIECKENTGFARASNIGACSAKGNYLLFLNPDTRLSADSFGKVLSFIKEKNEDGRAGVVGVRTLNPDGSLQYSCRSFPTLARQFYESYFLQKIFRGSRTFGSYFMTFWDHNSNREVDWLSGSFMLLKKNDFKKIGCFDEGYFIYSEDTDLCLRFNRDGFRNHYFSKYTIIHEDAGIAGKNIALREAQLWRSRGYYFRKNHSVVHSKVFSFLYLIYVINRIIMFAFLNVFRRNETLYRNRLTDYGNALKLYFSGR